MKENSASNRILLTGLWSQTIALIMGIGLHSSAILAGRTLFFGKIFTPALDLLFVPFITVGGLLGIWGYFPLRNHSRWLRIAGIAVSAYFFISIPFHMKTILSWSTAHFTEFPERYSFFIIPVQLLFLWIVYRVIQDEKGQQRIERKRTP